VSYLTMRLLTLQLFKNSIGTQEKLRLNLHSLSVSVSVSELLEYGRKCRTLLCDYSPSSYSKTALALKRSSD
jgi:hypothetical protein